MTRCKICQSTLRTEIDQQLYNNCNFNYLSNWCKERGFQVSPMTIKNHAVNHLKDYQLNQKDKPKVIPQNDTTSNVEFISFEAYCHSIGLHPRDFHDLENNLEKIIYGSQKALSLLFFKNTAIVDFKMNQHLINVSSFPSDQIRGLRTIFEMYARITGIELMVNENTAIKLLESLGYTISKNTIDIVAEN